MPITVLNGQEVLRSIRDGEVAVFKAMCGGRIKIVFRKTEWPSTTKAIACIQLDIDVIMRQEEVQKVDEEMGEESYKMTKETDEKTR